VLTVRQEVCTLTGRLTRVTGPNITANGGSGPNDKCPATDECMHAQASSQFQQSTMT